MLVMNDLEVPSNHFFDVVGVQILEIESAALRERITSTWAQRRILRALVRTDGRLNIVSVDSQSSYSNRAGYGLKRGSASR